MKVVCSAHLAFSELLSYKQCLYEAALWCA